MGHGINGPPSFRFWASHPFKAKIKCCRFLHCYDSEFQEIMTNHSGSRKSSPSESLVEVNENQAWAATPSKIFYHFTTSGISVAVATGVTHPLDVLKVRLQMQLIGQRGPLTGMGGLFVRLFKNEGPKALYLGLTPALTRSIFYGGLRLGLYEPSKHACDWAMLNVLKVRLQMQLIGQRGPLTGMGGLFVRLFKNEGPKALYLGLTPALTRSIFYGGLRLGLYEPSKHACDWAFGSTNILVKIASGAFAGAIATALTNPIEVLKVRLQMHTNQSQGGPIAEMRKVVSGEGITALWKGAGPAMARAAALTASQLTTYDETKRVLIRWTPLEEGFHLHLVSSTVAGITSTLITAPMDMIKTRLMLQRESKKVGIYKNGFHCAYQVMLTEGPRALYKGGFAIFARLGPQTTITFILCEKLREFAGLNAI